MAGYTARWRAAKPCGSMGLQFFGWLTSFQAEYASMYGPSRAASAPRKAA